MTACITRCWRRRRADGPPARAGNARRCALAATLLALAACSAGGDISRLSLGQAQISARGGQTELALALRFIPAGAPLEALERGVPLHLRVSLDGAGARRDIDLVLRHYPLSRRYQLHIDGSEDRSYALRGYLLDALERLRLPLADNPCRGAAPCRVEVRLDRSRLPGALRLPALLDPAWRLAPARAAVGPA